MISVIIAKEARILGSFCSTANLPFKARVEPELSQAQKLGEIVNVVLLQKCTSSVNIPYKRTTSSKSFRAFEWFCTVKYPKLITKFPKCLFCLLEHDIVPNYIFVRWFEDESLRNDYSMQASLISEKHLQYLKEVSAELKFIDYVRDDIKFAEEF